VLSTSKSLKAASISSGESFELYKLANLNNYKPSYSSL